MKVAAAVSLLIGSSVAFAPAQTGRQSTATSAALDDLKSLAEKSNPVLKVRIAFFFQILNLFRLR